MSSSGAFSARESLRLERLADVLDGMDQGLQVIGFDWRYLYLNKAAMRHGRSGDLVSMNMLEAYPGIEETSMFKTLEHCMHARESAILENQFTYPDGHRRWFELRVEPSIEGLTILSLDITERKNLEERYLHAQKMEAIGRLSGGVAHDFNNLLSVILSYTSMMLDEGAGELAGDLLEVRKAGERAAALTAQLLSFSRQSATQPRLLDPLVVTHELEKMLGRLLGEDVKLLVAPTNGRLIHIDRGLFEQVMMNLIINARDAMPAGGEVRVEAGEVRVQSDVPQLAPGEYVVVSIADTGGGMTKQTMERIFEPFFTTKERGHGTGLGLATVYDIMQQAHGKVTVDSELDRGSTFRLYFPVVAGVQAEVEPAPTPRSAQRGDESILVVEDDVQVLNVVHDILQRAGFRVLRAATANTALELARREKHLSLVLADAVMPGIGGRELVSLLRQELPDVRFMLMSGYSPHGSQREQLNEPNVTMLAKPLTPELVLTTVRRVLDAPVT